MAISAPARSIEAHATSISRRWMTSRIETLWTSTSYIDLSSPSGSIPWDIVRFPWGSMSTQSTRCPSSAKAAARFSVVVVLATPPFWLANAMTLAFPSTVAPMLELLESLPVGIRMVRVDSCMLTQQGTPGESHYIYDPGMAAGKRHDGQLRARLAGKRVIVTLGAGGVGKTTTSAALALGLAMRGAKAAVV